MPFIRAAFALLWGEATQGFVPVKFLPDYYGIKRKQRFHSSRQAQWVSRTYLSLLQIRATLVYILRVSLALSTITVPVYILTGGFLLNKIPISFDKAIYYSTSV